MNMTYAYYQGADNGQIASSTDAVTGEKITYQYDSLKRLISASSASYPSGTPIWSETYTLGGFGNMTGMTPTGSNPNLPSLSVSGDAATPAVKFRNPLQFLFLVPANKGAEAVLTNNADCDRLLNTGAPFNDPAAVLQSAYDNGQIWFGPFGDNVPPGVGAQTTGINGTIMIASNRYFVTGVLSNGTPVTQATTPNFQGLTLSEINEVILIHELLHFTGAVGDDNNNQAITLANGVNVTGSAGVTDEVRKDCLHH